VEKKHCKITFLPGGQSVAIHAGATLLDAAGQAGIVLNTPCGGSGTCKKCIVLVGPKQEETLACQYHIDDDAEVVIPTNSRFFQQQILEHGIEREIQAAPTICKHFISTVPSTLEEICSTLEKSLTNPVQGIHPEGVFEQEFAGIPQGVTAVLLLNNNAYQILCVEPGDTQQTLYGVAIDVGTTTLVARLVDLHSGVIEQTASAANPQIQYGDDVIGRIHHGQTEKGLEQLHQCVIGCLNDLIAELCQQEEISPEDIYEISAVGNTTMHHLLLKYPVIQLGQNPFEAFSTEAEDRNARHMGLNIHPQGRLYTVENIAGFVGSDTVAASLAAGLDTADQICLLVDIGTNGEIVLGTKDHLVAASCAAGPALEGARILHGGRGKQGAIQQVITDGEDIDLDVIGGGQARTICGSGLIDAVAVLLDLGIVEQSGRFLDTEALKGQVAPGILERVIEYNQQPAFVLAWKEESRQPSVILTQKDVREVQLAMAAIGAGILLLLKKLKLTKDQIECLYLAGAFGNYIRKSSAIRIGLLPAIPQEKIQFIGNAASVGAQMVLVSRHCRQIATDLARQIEYVEIAKEEDFQTVFGESILFP